MSDYPSRGKSKKYDTETETADEYSGVSKKKLLKKWKYYTGKKFNFRTGSKDTTTEPGLEFSPTSDLVALLVQVTGKMDDKTSAHVIEQLAIIHDLKERGENEQKKRVEEKLLDELKKIKNISDESEKSVSTSSFKGGRKTMKKKPQRRHKTFRNKRKRRV